MAGLLADTTYQAFEEVVKRSPNKIALIYLGEEYTFSKVHEMVLKLAASLYEMGVEKEEKVIIYLYNLPQTLIAWLALQRLEAVPGDDGFLPGYTPLMISDIWPMMWGRKSSSAWTPT